MKRLILCTILALMTISDGVCQSVIVGDKLPSTIFQRRWLMDIQPDEADYTCILFYHSESGLCQRVLNKVKTIVEEYGSSLNLVIITKERYDKAGVTLTEHLDDRVGVAFDEGGRLFKQLGVSFIPFCVVCDKKRRTLWCGNGAMFTRDVMNNILTTQ
ncbi:MAG: hypothetical protein J6Q29_05250 [Alistipes sp.]|nr:hypothetical protein [Alistipes sp.]